MYASNPIHTPIGRAASPSPYGYAAPVARPVSRAPSPQPYGYAAPIPRPASRAPSPAPYSYGAPIARPISRGPSPVPPGAHPNDHHRTPSSSGFQVEKRAKSPNPYGRPPVAQPESYRDEALYIEHVSNLIAAKDLQFAVTGRIPLDPADLVLFFRSKTGISYSLDFPIDVGYNMPPTLEVLIAACRPHQRLDYGAYSEREGLFYPHSLPATTSLEISNYPVLDAVRSALFPVLPPGQYLTAVRDGLDIVDEGHRITRHSPAQAHNDKRVATIIVTLPVRFRGGAIIVTHPNGLVEKFAGGGGKNSDIDWVAFRGESEYEVEQVQKGILMSLSYAVYIKSFGPSTPSADTLITPSDQFFDLSVGFSLNYDYNINPAEAQANALVPHLKGADALIYDAFKFHKLVPELHWTAGGFVWAKDQTLEFFGEDLGAGGNPSASPGARHSPNLSRPYSNPSRGPTGSVPPVRGAFGTYPGDPHYGVAADEGDAIRARVQASGAVSLQDANITVLRDARNPTPSVGRERVYFVSNGDLEKLVVNALIVVYIP
ncbi:hypothetical protein M413DRAFT_445252 [Hebeloma cylindrosporum]|uniref:Uncharacterized protein n=1 Tax=Hebeloma cylindrosporum TaxID=76867 RepID=A0A0C3CC80_HEBCY|nr:hypothetical protein M413DRAFT_445252 [Hebeloma cylindrosporum h7]